MVITSAKEHKQSKLTATFKGTHIKERKPLKRKKPTSKRGLSSQQICIAAASDRNGHEVALPIDKGKPSASVITESFEPHIQKQCCFLTDGLASYNQLAMQAAIRHDTLNEPKTHETLLHLNTVNHIHGLLKEMIYCIQRDSDKASKLNVKHICLLAKHYIFITGINSVS